MDADLAAAFDRLADFRAVQLAEHGGFTLEAVTCLQEAVGIGDEERRAFAGRLPEVSAGADPGAVLLGVLIGLLAAAP